MFQGIVGILRVYTNMFFYMGDIGAAMGHNILLIPGILFFVYAVFRRPGSRWAVVWGVAFVLFTIVRNLPGSPLAA